MSDTPMRMRRSWAVAPAHVAAWLYAAILVLPLTYLLISSLKSNLNIFTRPYGLPSDPLWGNFREAWNTAELGAALGTSVYVTLASVAVTLLLALPAAYALARSTGRAATIVQLVFAAGFLIPPFAALIPTVFLAIDLLLFQKKEFLIVFLPATGLPLSVILLAAGTLISLVPVYLVYIVLQRRMQDALTAGAVKG